MQPLQGCARCGSFVPTGARSCPHCDAAIGAPGKGRSVAVGLLALVGGGSLAVTLAACYGPPCAGDSCGTSYCNDPATDTDHDGYCGTFDCDETSADRHEFATDTLGDGIDQNCDGVDGTADAGRP